jgi:4-aminobutyrate aminotransferase-like enzyme
VIAFHGSYHGLSLGALAATAYKDKFREPFARALNPSVIHAPYPGTEVGPFAADEEGASKSLEYLEYLISSPATGVEQIGAVIFEPIQGRGGAVVPPVSWVRGLRELTRRHGIILIADEIFTGFGRTGKWFACEHFGIVPDVMCVGKALGGGFPISAAVGSAEVMAKWGGEAIHTSTFLGNPLGCAMALATLDILESEGLIARSAEQGVWLRSELLGLAQAFPNRLGRIRGHGLMLGAPMLTASGEPDGNGALRVMDAMLQRGYIMLPSGIFGHVLSFTPPLVIGREQLEGALVALREILDEHLTR